MKRGRERREGEGKGEQRRGDEAREGRGEETRRQQETRERWLNVKVDDIFENPKYYAWKV